IAAAAAIARRADVAPGDRRTGDQPCLLTAGAAEPDRAGGLIEQVPARERGAGGGDEAAAGGDGDVLVRAKIVDEDVAAAGQADRAAGIEVHVGDLAGIDPAARHRDIAGREALKPGADIEGLEGDGAGAGPGW